MPAAEFVDFTDAKIVPFAIATVGVLVANTGLDSEILTAWGAIGYTAITAPRPAQATTKFADFIDANPVPGGVTTVGILGADTVLDSAIIAAGIGTLLAATCGQNRWREVQDESENG